MTEMARKLAMAMIHTEMDRQLKQWGEQNHCNEVWLTILMEEIGEAAEATLKGGDVMGEVQQIAAVAATWLESRIAPQAIREADE